MTPECFAVEQIKKKVRRRTGVRSEARWRWVIYRASLDYDGRPVYLRRKVSRETYRNSRDYYMRCQALRALFGFSYGVAADRYELLDAKSDSPISERDALLFLPEMTLGAAALDKLRDLLELEQEAAT